MMNEMFSVTLRRILFMIRKELLATLKDPKSRIILVFPAIVQSLLFGYVATYNLDEAPYAVLSRVRIRLNMPLPSNLASSSAEYLLWLWSSTA